METTVTTRRVHPKYGVCLDLGCGTGEKRPTPGFSAYVDVIPVREGVVYPEPYYCTPMEDLSCFADKEFDYVKAHHSIEHCDDPDKACSEILRVGKAGCISFPPPQAEMMFGRRDHNWYIFIDHGRLLFVQKFHASLGIPRRVTGSELNVNFEWTDSFDWQVVRVDQ